MSVLVVISLASASLTIPPLLLASLMDATKFGCIHVVLHLSPLVLAAP